MLSVLSAIPKVFLRMLKSNTLPMVKICNSVALIHKLFFNNSKALNYIVKALISLILMINRYHLTFFFIILNFKLHTYATHLLYRLRTILVINIGKSYFCAMYHCVVLTHTPKLEYDIARRTDYVARLVSNDLHGLGLLLKTHTVNITRKKIHFQQRRFG